MSKLEDTHVFRSVRYHESGHTLALFIVVKKMKKSFGKIFDQQIATSTSGSVDINLNTERMSIFSDRHRIIIFLAGFLSQHMFQKSTTKQILLGRNMFLSKTGESYKEADTQRIVGILKDKYQIPNKNIHMILVTLFDECSEFISSKYLLGTYIQKIAYAHHQASVLRSKDIIRILGNNYPWLYFEVMLLELEKIIKDIIAARYQKNPNDQTRRVSG